MAGTAARTSRRRVILSWIPTAVIALICGAVALGAITMQNSWWVQPDAAPAADQESADGMSRFDTAGVHWFTRNGVVKMKLREEGASATDLGLARDGLATIEPIVPVDVVVLTPDGVLALDLITSITVETSQDRVESLTLRRDGNGAWTSASSDLAGVADDWGWTPDQLDRLVVDLTAASRVGGATAYSAELPFIQARGARVGARVDVDTAASSTSLSFTIAWE